MGRKRGNQSSQELSASPVGKRTRSLICTKNQDGPQFRLLPVEAVPITPNAIEVSTKQISSTASFNKKPVDENRQLIRRFGILNKYEDSETYLQKYSVVMSEDAAHYLARWCISLELENKRATCSHVAHQCVSIRHILELAKRLKVDPKDCISFFYERLKHKDGKCRDAFDEELRKFKESVVKLAKSRTRPTDTKKDVTGMAENVDPKGLDPVEVLKSLPKDLRKGFEVQNVEMLEDALSELSDSEVEYHMQRCVDSGLWIPAGHNRF